MKNVKVGNAAKQLGTTCKRIRELLTDARMIHQDAQNRWVTTRRGRDMETVVDHEGHYWNGSISRYQHYSTLHITPKGIRWLTALLTKEQNRDESAA